jgi:hypothetical protein
MINDNDNDPSVFWERLQESQRKRMKLKEDEKGKLQNEIETTNSAIGASVKTSNDDIIENDVSG